MDGMMPARYTTRSRTDRRDALGRLRRGGFFAPSPHGLATGHAVFPMLVSYRTAPSTFKSRRSNERIKIRMASVVHPGDVIRPDEFHRAKKPTLCPALTTW